MLINYNTSNNNNCLHFIHGNSLTPESYSPILNQISDNFEIKTFLLRPLFDKSPMPKFKNWDIFLNDYLSSIKNQNNIIGLGHSIGGNLILRAALNQPNKFKKIILLDPTMLVPIKTFFWNIMCIFKLQSKFLPLINKAKNKKMVFNDLNEVFDSYRNKTIFSNFNNQQLTRLIKSITKDDKGKIKLVFPANWDARIFSQGMRNDLKLWNKIKDLDVETIIVRASNSNIFYKETENALLKRNNKIKFLQIDGDHFFPINKAEETADIISKYL